MIKVHTHFTVNKPQNLYHLLLITLYSRAQAHYSPLLINFPFCMDKFIILNSTNNLTLAWFELGTAQLKLVFLTNVYCWKSAVRRSMVLLKHPSSSMLGGSVVTFIAQTISVQVDKFRSEQEPNRHTLSVSSEFMSIITYLYQEIPCSRNSYWICYWKG